MYASVYTPNGDPINTNTSTIGTVRSSEDTTPIKTQRVSKKLKDGRIIADYFKPAKREVYSLIASPEIENYEKFERDFYSKYGNKLKIYDVRKVDLMDKAIYSNGNEAVQYFKPTGAVIYNRNSSEKYLNEGASKNMEKSVKDFITEYGGGLPKDAELTGIYPVKVTNMSIGEVKTLSYLLNFSRKYKGIKITGPGADGLVVEVDADGITYYQRLWRNYQIDTKYKINADQLVDETEALDRNASTILSNIKASKDNPLKFTEVNLVYKSSRFDEPANTISPAWEYKCGNNNIYIDATTGDILE